LNPYADNVNLGLLALLSLLKANDLLFIEPRKRKR